MLSLFRQLFEIRKDFAELVYHLVMIELFATGELLVNVVV